MITTVLLLYENMNLLHTVDSANDNAVHVIVHFVVWLVIQACMVVQCWVLPTHLLVLFYLQHSLCGFLY